MDDYARMIANHGGSWSSLGRQIKEIIDRLDKLESQLCKLQKTNVSKKHKK